MKKKIVISVFLWKLLIILLYFVGSTVMPLYAEFIPKEEFREGFPSWFWVWGNFDGFHYLSIAKYGYGQLQNPFFPLYPLLIRFFHQVTGFSYLLSALMISNILFLLALFVIRKIMVLDKQIQLFPLVIGVIFLFPTSFAYGSVYNDALFLLLACLTLYFARKQSFILASFTAAFATLTRLNGLALVFLILFEFYTAHETAIIKTWHIRPLINRMILFWKDKDIIKKQVYAVMLVPMAFLVYLAFTHRTYGSWELVFSSMKVWNQEKVTFPLQVFWRYFKIIALDPTGHINYYVAILEVSMVLFYIGVIIYTFKKIRFSYWIFVVLSILIPSLTGTFAGMPRYALHIYPLFLGIALFLSHHSTVGKLIYFVFSFVLLFFCVMLFTRGYFVT